MGDPRHPLSYCTLLLQFTWVGLHYISIYVLTRVFCVLLYARVSLSIYNLALDFFSGARNRWRFCLSSYLFPFSFSCFISALVFINFYVFEISIVYVFKLIFFFLRVCYSSFMNYYGILISAASYSDISVSVILWFVFHLLQIYLQCGILSNSSPTCVAANGWK